MIKFPRQTIETERLLLIPYHQKFAKEYFTLIQKNKNRLKDSFPTILHSTTTEQDTQNFIEQKIFDWNKNKAYAFLILEKSSNQLIGHFNIKELNWKKREADIGYFIDADFEGKGLMTETVQVVLQTCFIQIQLQRLTAKVATTNNASVHVLEKVGMKYEGAFFSNFTTFDNQQTDTNCFGITRDAFLRT